MENWFDISRSEKFQELPQEEQVAVKQRFFERFMLPKMEEDEDLKNPEVKQAVFQKFMSSPNDTGQGYVTSMLGAAGRGFGEVVPGAIEGFGALTGIEPLREGGQAIREGLEFISPVNPIYEEGVMPKIMQTAGNVGSILATAGIGGAIGKGLAAERIAAAGTTAAEQAIARKAIETGAKSALYSTGFAQGAAEKSQENERLGISGPEAYMNLVGGGLSEIVPEMLPFGTALETAAARRVLGGVDEAGKVIPGIRLSAAQEAAEGGATKVLSNISTQMAVPAGTEAPGLFEGVGEAALWEGVGGGMFGAINKLGRTPAAKQTDIQKSISSKAGGVPVDTVPEQTEEEKLKAAEAGGATVVAPDGKTAVIAPEEPSMPDPAEVAKTIGEASVENLAATGNEASAAAQAQFNATYAQATGKAAEPTIQPEQAAEEVEAEVTPSPAMEMPEKSSQTITGSNGEIAPEMPVPVEPGEASIQPSTIDLLKQLEAKRIDAKNKIQPPTIEPQENAPRKIPLEESLPEEPQDRVEVGPTEGPSPSDQLRSPAEGEVKGEVVDPEMQELQELTLRRGQTQNKVKGVRFTKKDELRFKELSEKLRPQLRETVDPQNDPIVGEDINDQPIRQSSQGTYYTFENGRVRTGPSFKEEPITPQGTPTPATEGMVTPGGVATERDLTKPEQMTPEEAVELEYQRQIKPLTPSEYEQRFPRPKDSASRLTWVNDRKRYLWQLAAANINIPNEWVRDMPSQEFVMEAGYVKQGNEWVRRKSGIPPWKGVMAKNSAIMEYPRVVEWLRKKRENAEIYAASSHSDQVNSAVWENESKPSVSASAVDTYGIKLPEGYIKQGDLYIFQPSSDQSGLGASAATAPQGVIESPTALKAGKAQTTAAETQTPVPLREGTGAAGVVQSESAEGSISAVGKVSPKTESESREKTKKAAKARTKRSKAIDSIIGEKERRNRKFGQVSNADAVLALTMLHNSGDVPGVLTSWVGTKEDYLRDPANRLLDPEVYDRLKSGELVEGLFHKGRVYIFLDGIGVSEADRLRGEFLDISPQVAAVRRVLLHENLVHRGIHGLPLRHRRLILNWVRENSTPAELDSLAELYSEYADWRNSTFQFEALAEEFLAKKVDSLTEIPKDGPMAKLMDILRQIWQFITGSKKEPTLTDLKSVVKLLKSGAEVVSNDVLKDGGEVKLSAAYPKSRITPEMDAEYMAAVEAGDMETAQRMVDEAAKDAGFNVGPVPHGTTAGPFNEFRVPAYFGSGAAMYAEADSELVSWKGARTTVDTINPRQIEDYLDTATPPKGFNYESPFSDGGIGDFVSFGGDGIYQFKGMDGNGRYQYALVENLTPIRDESFNIVGVEKAPPPSEFPRIIDAYLKIEKPALLNAREGSQLAKGPNGRWNQNLYDRLVSNGNDGVIAEDDWGGPWNKHYIVFSPSQIKSADPVTRDESGNVIPLSKRFQTASPDIRFSRPEYSSDYTAAKSAGEEAARSTLYSERDMDIREAIRRAYEAMPKTNSVAVPIGELFAKTKELMPDVSEDEFSNVLQDMFEDNGVVLQEGEVVEPLTEQDRRYLTLAEDEEANQEELQRMVDEAAIGIPQKTLTDAGLNVSDITVETWKEVDTSGDTQWWITLKNGWSIDGTQSWTERTKRAVLKEAKRARWSPDTRAILRDDQGRIIPLSRRFDTDADIRGQINVTTPEGQRAGFVVVMPRAAKASRIKAEDVQSASKQFQSDVIEAGKGRVDTADYQGNRLKSVEAPEHNVNAPELYLNSAVNLVDSLLSQGYSIQDIAESIQDPDFKMEIGLLGNKAISSNMSQQADLFLGAEIQNRLQNAIRKERDLAKKRALEKTLKTHKLYYTTATGIGQNLNAVNELQQNPRFKWMFLFDKTEAEMAEKAKEKLDAITGGTQGITDAVNKVDGEAADAATQEMEDSSEDDQDAADLEAGEATLNEKQKTAWERFKDAIRTKGLIAKALAAIRAKKAGNQAKASLSQEDRNAIFKMSEEELLALDAKMDEVMREAEKAFFADGDAKTKETREKMVKTAKKRGSKGKSLNLSDIESASQVIAREMGKSRPGKMAPFTKMMPWRQILGQRAKTVDEYRQRILDAMMQSDAFKEVSDEDKASVADIFAKQWEAKRKAILDSMLQREINEKLRKNEITKAAADALQKSRNKIIELVNLGGFDNDDLMKILGEKFDISTSFTEEQKARISELANKLQDENLNPAKRNKLAMEFAVTLAGASEIPIAEIIANWWTSSVLFGPQTIFSIGAAFVNGAYIITTIGTRRMLANLTKGNIQGAIEESILMLQGIVKYLGAFKQAGRRAWSYLWTGNIDVLGASANDILGEIKSLEDLKKFNRHKMLAENLAKDPRALRRYVGMYLRFVNRLLTALDAFNVMVTKAATTSLALRMSGMSTENIIKAEKMLNLKSYKDKVIRDYFDNKAPTNLNQKALVDSYAEAEMYRAVEKLGGKMENADYLASESAMTMNPTGLGGFFYRSITGIDGKMKKAADEYLEKAKKDWISNRDYESGLFLGLAYLRQFAVQNLGGVAGYKFIRFASNKFNQGISYLPMIGLLRALEAKGDEIKGKEAFIETIHRNQVIGAIFTLAAIAVVKALEDEPDDEERGNFWNGGWENLTPDQKKQMLAKGQKEYTMGFKFNGRWYVFNYQNWPLNQVFAAIGSMSDQIRFSPKQWNEKNALSKTLAGMVSGVKSTLEIPALSQLGEIVGNRLASKDPTEQSIDRFSRIASGWAGGFVPRILKDLDFYTQPELRKYQGLWEKTASHIPIYRRYVGDEYYDILGQPIKRNVIPGSREFMAGPTEPEYKILGALNSRNIWLTPANAEYRMVGKGRNRRRLTQDEADAYSLETGKGYRQMLLRYGQRALQMPTERARAFLQDKADEVRDRALRKVYRR